MIVNVPHGGAGRDPKNAGADKNSPGYDQNSGGGGPAKRRWSGVEKA